MIQSLTVKNIALIDELNIEFSEGLNVLSGETGAGKSIVVDSMNLLLGERADRELIRSGKEKAHVEAVLKIAPALLKDFFEQNELEEEEELLLSRDISVSGKNVCRINGTIVNLATLKELTDKLIDLHGQHAHQALLYAKNHILFIDNFCRKESAPRKERITALYQELKNAQVRLKETGGDEKERMHTIDLLSFQIREITDAQICPGEGEGLKAEREKLKNAQEIAQALSLGYAELYLGGEEGGSALSLVQDAALALGRIAAFDQEYEALAERLNESAYAIEECAHDLRTQADRVVFDEQRQMEIEERIDVLNALKRKYGNTEEEILSYCEETQQRLQALENADVEAERLQKEITRLKDELYAEYVGLSDIRKRAAQVLSKRILKEFSDLGMPNVCFEARFALLPAREEAVFQLDGIDEMEFYISVNVGEPLKPLQKTASGGEISRIMLAFKNISAGIDDISTMIFDEIDTGISGKMALVVSEKMASIARLRQVICVTHLPQIAAMADANFLIRKHTNHGETNTTVSRLTEDEAINEIARLAGGIETDSSRQYAEELRQNAQEIKKVSGI